jgi:hypothetical protein
MEERVCTKCKETKPVDEFYLNCYGRNGACKACVREKNRAYYLAKKGEIAAKHLERRGQPVQVGALAQRRERPFEERYAERRAKVNENKRERLQTNPQNRATINVDNRFRRALAAQGHALELMVGCSAATFHAWIESQFVEGMSVDNYGDVWTYDHVIPKSAFDFLNPMQVKECNHWSNWRPVFPTENSSKNCKRDQALEESHAMLAYLFELLNDVY